MVVRANLKTGFSFLIVFKNPPPVLNALFISSDFCRVGCFTSALGEYESLNPALTAPDVQALSSPEVALGLNNPCLRKTSFLTNKFAVAEYPFLVLRF